jgi:hypothetical protein
VGSVGCHSIVGTASAEEHQKRSLHCADIDEVMYFFPYSCFLIFGSGYTNFYVSTYGMGDRGFEYRMFDV